MPITAKRMVISVSLSINGDGLSFKARGRDALDERTLKENEEGQDRKERKYRHREHCTPIRLSAGIQEATKAELDGEVLHVREVDEWPEEIVPGEDKREDRSRSQCR